MGPQLGQMGSIYLVRTTLVDTRLNFVAVEHVVFMLL